MELFNNLNVKKCLYGIIDAMYNTFGHCGFRLTNVPVTIFCDFVTDIIIQKQDLLKLGKGV